MVGSFRLQRNARRIAAAALLISIAASAQCAAARERTLIDADWRFKLGDASEAAQPDFDDSSWRTVNLPHDWSIELAPAADQPSGGAGGYFPAGIAWYRRTFTTPDNWKDQRVTIDFEGVYQHATVWLNGHELGKHAYGYTPFAFDISQHLNADGSPNILAVRVDNSAQPNCRWYSGSGIYRHVWLEATNSLHIDRDESFIETHAINDDGARVRVGVGVANDAHSDNHVALEGEVLDPNGQPVAEFGYAADEIDAGERAVEHEWFTIPAPKLWSPESPQLYRVVARLKVDDRVIDELQIPFGIRTVKVTPEHGFQLNGKTLELFGGCVHHDNGPLGAAAFDRAEQRRVEILKAAGFNAIRTSHNPPSTAFLDACDRLGMLVIDEAFDGWAAEKVKHGYHEDFAENWQADLAAMICRDRNHPSVVMWSIGNEVYERGKESGATIAADMRAAVLELDATRPITAAANGLGDDEKWPGLDPFFASLDVAGYNYELDRIEPDHERLPNRVIQITESFQSEAFAAWDLVQQHPYVIGEFLWTAMDYLGEAGIGRTFPPGEKVRHHWEGEHFPWIGAYCGDIDLTGFRKPISHYRNIIWDRGEKLYAAVRTPPPLKGDGDGDGKWQPTLWSLPPEIASWTWPGHEGQDLEVVVYSRYDEVDLYLNDKFIATQPTGLEQQFKATFRVPYQSGELRITGNNFAEARPAGGRMEVEKLTLTTADAPAKLRLTPDRTDLTANGQDLVFITSEITDFAGHVNPTDLKAKYTVTGPATIAAIGNGNLWDATPYHADPRAHYEGRALVILRTTTDPGEITLTAEAEGFGPATITVSAKIPN